jgi:hypothetical protein
MRRLSKARSVVSRRGRDRGNSLSSVASTPDARHHFTPEEQRVEDEIRRRVRLVVLAGGAGSDFSLKWKTVSLDGAGRGFKSHSGEESDAYESDFSVDEVSFSSAKVRQIAKKMVAPDARKSSASTRSSPALAMLNDGRDDSTVVPMMGSWVVSLKRELSLSSKTHTKLVPGERRLLALDDENKVLYVCQQDSLLKAQAIPYNNIEGIRGHYGDDGVFYISLQIRAPRRVRRGEKSRTLYFRTVRMSRPFEPDYAVSAMVRWVAALRFRARLYDTTTWSEQDQAKHAALAIQRAFRVKKSKAKRAELREFLDSQNTVGARITSFFRGTAALDEKRQRAVSDLFGDDGHGLPSSLSCITPELKRSQSSMMSFCRGASDESSTVTDEAAGAQPKAYGASDVLREASEVSSAILHDVYTLTGLRRLGFGGGVETIKEESE